MLDQSVFVEIMEGLSNIEQDGAVPKNVRIKVKTAMDILSNESEANVNMRIDRSLQELGEIAEDPNLESHTRMQIWSVVSRLESK